MKHLFKERPPAMTRSLHTLGFLLEAKVRVLLQTDKRATGVWLRNRLISMGPAFVKLGQFLSTRSDIFTPPITKELSQLQDAIDPVPFDDIQLLIRAAYAQPLDQLFSSIEETPLATASIGQVHRATLKTPYTTTDSSIQEVVIKIQKPGIAQALRSDLAIFKQLNRALMWIDPMRRAELDGLIRQYESFLSAELDFQKELKNMQDFIGSPLDAAAIRIPMPVEALSSETLLVMEYVPSIKITDLDALRARSVDGRTLATALVRMFLTQFVQLGLVHCDPHPGNVGVTEDGATLVLYDFGNVVRLSEGFRSRIRGLIFAVYSRDVDEFIELLMAMNIVQVPEGMDALEIKAFFTFFFSYLETLDSAALRESIATNEFIRDAQIQVRMDPSFLSLVRVFSLLDGTCSRLDPKFNYIEALAPYTLELITDLGFIDYRARRDLQKLVNYPATMQDTNKSIARMSRRMRTVTSDLNTMQLILIGVFAVENLHDPLLMASLLPLLVLLRWLRRRGQGPP